MNDLKIEEIMEVHARGINTRKLSSWEVDFLETIETEWDDADNITDRMQEILDGIHERLVTGRQL